MRTRRQWHMREQANPRLCHGAIALVANRDAHHITFEPSTQRIATRSLKACTAQSSAVAAYDAEIAVFLVNSAQSLMSPSPSALRCATHESGKTTGQSCTNPASVELRGLSASRISVVQS